MTNHDSARKARLLAELRQGGVADERVLAAIEKVAREVFVPLAFQTQAWDNAALPIGHGQTVSQPLVVGLMTQALALTDRTKVLEIGTGSGYQAAVLSRLARRVYTIERHRALLNEALERFHELRIHNITALYGDGTRGWPEQAPFDRILITAAGPDIPQPLIDQLADDGVMVMPLGESGRADQVVVRIHKTKAGLHVEDLFPVRFVPLISGPLPDNGERSGRHH